MGLDRIYENIKTIKLIKQKNTTHNDKAHVPETMTWAFWYVWMVESTMSGSLASLVDYGIFCLGWDSEDTKTDP